jgi:hypothetical protein
MTADSGPLRPERENSDSTWYNVSGDEL